MTSKILERYWFCLAYFRKKHSFCSRISPRISKVSSIPSVKSDEKIQKLLIDRGWSQSELARQAGVNQRSVAYAASGEREPRVRTAVAIAKALAVDVAWLWGDDSWPPIQHGLKLSSASRISLVEEVARRRDETFEEIKTIRKNLPPNILKSIEQALSSTQMRAFKLDEIDRVVRMLQQIEMRHRELQALNPDIAFPPGERPVTVGEIVGGYPRLKQRFESSLAAIDAASR